MQVVSAHEGQTRRDQTSGELDILTIRRRVARIKNRWSPEVAQARAAEGARRRQELDRLVAELPQQAAADKVDSQCDRHGLTLVG